MDESISLLERKSLEGRIRRHALPQTHPYHHLDQADFVGRFENLEADFGKVCKKLDIEYNGLPHWNITDRKSYREYFNKESKALADEFLKQDIEELDYEF